MSATRSPRPTNLPTGISAGGLGARVGAYLLDAVVILLAYAGIAAAVLLSAPPTVLIVVSVAGGLVWLGWLIFLWWRLAVRGATPGMAVAKLELIGHRNGRPIGWGRVLLRALIFGGLSATGIGQVIMLIMLVMHPLRQGWHDLAVEAVVITARATSSRPAGSITATPDRLHPAGHTVGLPAHLTAGTASSAPRRATSGYTPPSGPPTPGPAFGDPFNQPVRSAGGASDQWAPPAPPDTPPLPAAVPRQPARGGLSPMDVGNEATHLVAKRGGMPQRAPDQGWVVKLDDGRQISVAGLVLLGRDPSPRPGEQAAELVAVTDNTRTVSKTHIAVGVDTKGVFVMDRGSTNGSAIAMPTGKYEPCAPGELVRVREGQIISFGDHRMEIRRTY